MEIIAVPVGAGTTLTAALTVDFSDQLRKSAHMGKPFCIQ